MAKGKGHLSALCPLLLCPSRASLCPPQRGGGPPAPVNAGDWKSARRSPKARSSTTRRARRVTGRTGRAVSSARRLPRRIAAIFAAPIRRFSTRSRTASPARRCRRMAGQFSDDQHLEGITAYIRGLRGTAIDTPARATSRGGEAVFWAKAPSAAAATWSKGRAASSDPICRTLRARARCRTSSTRSRRWSTRSSRTAARTTRRCCRCRRYQPVRVTTADGKVVSGILKNEDSFSLQVLGRDDLNLYRFKRAGREGVLRSQSLMPHDWDKRLSPAEFQNLLAFLTRLYVPPPPAPPARGGGAPVG